MNRPLRKVHFGLVAILTPVAIGIFTVSISARKAIPLSPTPGFLPAPAVAMRETGRRLVHAEGFDVEVRGLMDSSGTRYLEFTPLNQPHVADLLAYIGPEKNPTFDNHVRLLGPVYSTCPVRFALPADSTQTLSEIYLYSEATRTVVGRVNLADSTTGLP